MSTLVSVGRNIGDAPMDDADWLAFRVELEQCLEPFEILTTATGYGQWNGQGEASHIVVCGDIADEEVDEVRGWLADLARAYRQDAIALTRGSTLLVPAA